jgi:photosystem II stability/assembly factor-like uncharacterized protein
VSSADRDVLDTVLRSGRVGVVALVLVLTVGDAVLVSAALHRSHREDPSAAVVVRATPQPTVSPSPSIPTTRPATRQSGAQVVSVTDGANRLFTAASSTTAWRAHGGCTGTPKLSRTTDGARTWSALTAPAPHLLRIDLTGADGGWVIGVDAKCGSPTYYGTVDGGATWAASPTLGLVWLPLHTGVRTPSGATTSPCGHHTAPRSLAPAGTTDALSICPTGVMRTTDAGAHWASIGRVPAGRSVIAALGGHGHGVLVLTGAPHCDGLRVLTTANVGSSWARGSCLADAIEPASVAVAADGSGLLVSAGRAYTTTDGGKHWS